MTARPTQQRQTAQISRAPCHAAPCAVPQIIHLCRSVALPARSRRSVPLSRVPSQVCTQHFGGLDQVTLANYSSKSSQRTNVAQFSQSAKYQACGQTQLNVILMQSCARPSRALLTWSASRTNSIQLLWSNPLHPYPARAASLRKRIGERGGLCLVSSGRPRGGKAAGTACLPSIISPCDLPMRAGEVSGRSPLRDYEQPLVGESTLQCGLSTPLSCFIGANSLGSAWNSVACRRLGSGVVRW